MGKTEESGVSDSWSDGAAETLKVGDVFTEEWLDKFRGIMAAYGEATALLHDVQKTLRGCNVHDVIATDNAIKAFFKRNGHNYPLPGEKR